MGRLCAADDPGPSALVPASRSAPGKRGNVGSRVTVGVVGRSEAARDSLLDRRACRSDRQLRRDFQVRRTRRPRERESALASAWPPPADHRPRVSRLLGPMAAHPYGLGLSGSATAPQAGHGGLEAITERFPGQGEVRIPDRPGRKAPARDGGGLPEVIDVLRATGPRQQSSTSRSAAEGAAGLHASWQAIGRRAGAGAGRALARARG